ncbi:MAG: DUF6113 family protein [Actinocrinis sp.]
MTRPKPTAAKGAASKSAATVKAAGARNTGTKAAATAKSAGSTDVGTKDATAAPDDSFGAAQRAVTTGKTPPERVARYALLLLAIVLGVVVGAVGTFGHRASETWGGVSWPTGLVLCLGGLIGLLLGLSELLEAGLPGSWRPTRLPAVAWASAGWLVALLWLTYAGPPSSGFARKGDVLLPNDTKSLVFLLGGMALVTAAVFRAWTATLTARLGQRPGAAERGHPKG